MKVRIDETPPEGRVVDLEEDGSRLFRDEPDLRFEEKVRSRLRLDRVAGSVALSGKTRTRVSLQCSRCLEAFGFDIGRDYTLEYRPVSEVSEKMEIQLAADEMDIEYYSEDAIDLDEVVMGQIAEAIPLKPLCNENCRGLCLHCGKNLNEGDCGCAGGPIDPRLAKLKDLLKKEDPPSPTAESPEGK